MYRLTVTDRLRTELNCCGLDSSTPTHLERSGNILCQLGGVTDSRTTPAGVEWTTVLVALSTFLATNSRNS
jgi:hypothetical protein